MYKVDVFLRRKQKFREISFFILTLFIYVKTKWEISSNFVAFSEYLNFKKSSATSERL